VAFIDGGFENGPRPAHSVPEPGSAWLACLSLLFGWFVAGRRRAFPLMNYGARRFPSDR
jgi:hypothetical protein